MAELTRVNGTAGSAGALNGNESQSAKGTPVAWTLGAAQLGQSVVFYKVELIDAASAQVALTNEDDTPNELLEVVLRQLPSVLAFHAVAATGIIHVCCDGHAAPAASKLQTAIQGLGTSVGVNGADISLSTVTLGTSFVVA